MGNCIAVPPFCLKITLFCGHSQRVSSKMFDFLFSEQINANDRGHNNNFPKKEKNEIRNKNSKKMLDFFAKFRFFSTFRRISMFFRVRYQGAVLG